MGEVKGKGRQVERHDNWEREPGVQVFFGRHQSLTHHDKWMLNGRAEVDNYRC